MKKNCIIKLSMLLLTLVFTLTACNNADKKKGSTHEYDINERGGSTISTIKAESGTKIISMQVQGSIAYDTRDQTSIASRVSGRIERLLIKYNYQPVKKGQLIMEIYSPDLAAAQRELLFIYQTDKNGGMLQLAKQRLLLLGMREAQVRQILSTGKIMYRIPVYSNASGYILEKPAPGNLPVTSPGMASPVSPSPDNGMDNMGPGGNAPPAGNSSVTAGTSPSMLLREGQYVSSGEPLFTIYTKKGLIAEFYLEPSQAAQVKKGKRIIFHATWDRQTVYAGTIGLVQPKLKEGSNFTLAKVYLKDNRFMVGQLITADIPIARQGWWLPQRAVLDLGNRSVVFKREHDVFMPMEVKAKIIGNGLVLIENDIGNWQIASNAAFLEDSESFIKTASGNQTKKSSDE